MAKPSSVYSSDDPCGHPKRNRFFPGKSRGSPLFFPGEPPFGLLSILFLPVSPPMLVLVGHCQAVIMGGDGHREGGGCSKATGVAARSQRQPGLRYHRLSQSVLLLVLLPFL